jgi:hypothetical protein
VRCVAHKLKDMVCVRIAPCEEPGCDVQPSFNYKGVKPAVRCVAHKLKDMVNVVSAPCDPTFAAFNHQGHAWGQANSGGFGPLNITYLPNGDVLIHISSPHTLQTELRRQFVLQELSRGRYVVFSEADQVSRIPPRRAQDINDDDEANYIYL